MNEREMEDLLAAYPEEFFPRQSLVLKGRQQAFVGVGRFDLLFEDNFRTQILMELKARPARYEDATQVARYKDQLADRGEVNVLMWLVAPQIPNSVREFLDRIGIQYSEIHFVEFQRVAQRHGIAIQSEPTIPVGEMAPKPPVAAQYHLHTAKLAAMNVETGPRVTAPGPLRWRASGHDLVLQNPDALDEREFSALVDTFERSVPSRKNAHLVADLRTWATNPRLIWALGSCSSLLRWTTTSGWKDAVPHAEAIWNYLFGKPAPTWYQWDQGRRKYHLDGEGWNVWYGSLPH